MGHIRLLSRLHCAVSWAWFILYTSLIILRMLNKKEAFISPMQLPHCPPWYRKSDFDPASVYWSAQRRMVQQRMLMRHMHMGIIMDIIICCFIFVRSFPH